MKRKLNPLNISIKIFCNQEFKHAVMYFEKFGYKLGFKPYSNIGNYGINNFIFLNKTYNPHCIDMCNNKYHKENLEVTISELGKLKLFKIKVPKWKKIWKEQ